MQHTTSVWPMYVSLRKVEKLTGRWTSVQWEIEHLLPATHEAPQGTTLVLLELHKDERASYRINLDMDNAMLYLVCDEMADGTWVPALLSADQNVAAGCLEGNTPVINMLMPEAIACWIEAFITQYGEVEIAAYRRKHVDGRNNQGPSRDPLRSDT